MTKNIWRTVNTVLAIVTVWVGYIGMTPERLRGTNPDKYLCFACLIIMPLFVLGGFVIWRDALFRRPSWDRCPIVFWRRDPLQALFFSTVFVLGVAIGSSLRVSHAGVL